MIQPVPGQLEAFPPPIRAVSVTAHYDEGRGWALQALLRREGQTFAPAGGYERLTRDELVDVLLVVVLDLLEVADQR